MQINRLFEIVYLLLMKKHTTAHELAEHFEVSKRTILRDIDTLIIAGIPIYTMRGKGGGIAILNNFILDKAVISEEEQKQILFALQSVSPTQYMDVDDVLSKLSALFKKEEANWVEVDFSRWGNNTLDQERFKTLKTVILNKQAIAFSYASSYGETKERTVYPLKLVFKSKAWYLQAYCPSKQTYRTFKLNRIMSIRILSESFFNRELNPPPIEISDDATSIEISDDATLSLIHLVLLFAPDVAYRVYDEFDTNDVRKNKDGSFTVVVDLPEDYWLYGFLLSFGAAVKIIEPKSVAEKLLSQIDEGKKLYSKK